MTLHIGTILIAKEDRFMNGETFKPWVIKGNSYKIIRYRSHEDDYMIIDEQGDEHFIGMDYINQHFTIKRYTITDLNEKKIAVKLKSEEEFKRISPNDDYIWFFDNSYFGYENGQFTFIDNKSLTKQGYILIPSIDLIDLEEKEESKVVESHHVKQLESIDEIDLGDEGKEVVVNDCETDAIYIAKLETEISRLDEQIARLKGDVEKLNEVNQNLNKEINKWIDTATRYKNEITELRESPQISQDLEKRERMAWELMLRSVQVENSKHYSLSAEYCLNEVDTFLAKSKEVGNGK